MGKSYEEKMKHWPSKILKLSATIKLGDKERSDKEQIGVKEPFPVTYFCPFLNM